MNINESGSKIISVVVPVYNEETNITPLVEKIDLVFSKEDKYDYRILFVDDCSTDGTWDVITKLRNENISAIRFSTNFGKEAALVAGLNECTGFDAVIFMDGDLQHPPELIPTFLRKWEGGFQNVSGVRNKSEDYTLFKKIASGLFYKIMNVFSEVYIRKGLTDYKLLDKRVVNEFLKFKEKSLMFRGLVEWMGFSSTYVYFDAPPRLSGEVSYSFRKLYRLAWNSFTSFSLLPLKAAGLLGAIIIVSSISLLLFMLLTEAIGSQVFTAMAYFTVFNTLLTGVVLSSIGFIAIYIGRIHTEVIDRPLYIISDTCDTPRTK